jgi:hypothetical protein
MLVPTSGNKSIEALKPVARSGSVGHSLRRVPVARLGGGRSLAWAPIARSGAGDRLVAGCSGIILILIKLWYSAKCLGLGLGHTSAETSTLALATPVPSERSGGLGHAGAKQAVRTKLSLFRFSQTYKHIQQSRAGTAVE